MFHVEEHCYKWNLHKMTFWILVQKPLLWSFMIFWYLWLSWGCCFQRYNGICKKLFWLAFTFFQHQHSPICQLCNHWTSLNLWTHPLSCSRLSSGQYERLGATGHPPLIPHHSLRRKISNHPNSGIQKELSIPLRISHPTSARHQVLTRKSLLCKAHTSNLRLWFLPTPTSSTEVRYQA